MKLRLMSRAGKKKLHETEIQAVDDDLPQVLLRAGLPFLIDLVDRTDPTAPVAVYREATFVDLAAE